MILCEKCLNVLRYRNLQRKDKLWCKQKNHSIVMEKKQCRFFTTNKLSDFQEKSPFIKYAIEQQFLRKKKVEINNCLLQ